MSFLSLRSNSAMSLPSIVFFCRIKRINNSQIRMYESRSTIWKQTKNVIFKGNNCFVLYLDDVMSHNELTKQHCLNVSTYVFSKVNSKFIYYYFYLVIFLRKMDVEYGRNGLINWSRKRSGVKLLNEWAIWLSSWCW